MGCGISLHNILSKSLVFFVSIWICLLLLFIEIIYFLSLLRLVFLSSFRTLRCWICVSIISSPKSFNPFFLFDFLTASFTKFFFHLYLSISINDFVYVHFSKLFFVFYMSFLSLFHHFVLFRFFLIFIVSTYVLWYCESVLLFLMCLMLFQCHIFQLSVFAIQYPSHFAIFPYFNSLFFRPSIANPL